MPTPYRNIGGDSQITFYDIGSDYIDIWFPGWKYRYSYASAGQHNIEEMKRLAKSGDNLTTYINKYVSDKYEAKARA